MASPRVRAHTPTQTQTNMGAGRRTETYLGPNFPTAGASASSSSSAQFLNLPPGELGSVIFGCTHATYDECISQLIFGLPRPHYSYIKNIKPGMKVFLFNYSDRKLHGIFEAESHGDLDINSYAWTGGKAGKTQFSAQVRVRVKHHCQPLTEKMFKEAIAANYYKSPQNHFYFELNHVQTDMILTLFRKNGSYTSSQAGPSAQTQGIDEDGWIKTKKTFESMMDGRHMDVWHNAVPFVPGPAQTSTALSERWAATPEQWDDGSDKVEDATVCNGGPDSEDAVNRILEPAAEKPLDWRGTGKLSNAKVSEVEEEHKKTERELEVFEKLRHMRQKGKVQSIMEVKAAEVPSVQEELQEEASGSSFIDPSNVQDSARIEWERLARERCLQEQTMLREERELLREKFQALDAPVAKAVNKNLEICASAIAQMRQDQIKLRHLMDEAMSQAELLSEMDHLRKKNKALEDSQVQMASEVEGLKSDVARLSQQLQTLSRQTNQMPHQSDSNMHSERQVDQTVFTNGNGNEEYFRQIFLIGGYDGHSWRGSVDILCPATYEFTPAAPMLTARSYAAATVLMGSIYVFGGGNGSLWYETVETYDYERDRWIPSPPMSLKRGSLAGATVGGRIFAVGGGNSDVYFSEVECYDAHLGQWISSTSMLSKRFGVAAAELNGALYAMGGYSEKKYLASVERFDPREALWTAVAPMTRKRGSFSAVTLGGQIYAIGGYDGDQFLNSMEFYEPRTNHWVEIESKMHTGRAYGAVAQTGSNIYMFGGLNKGCYVDTVECYRESNGWREVPEIALGGRCFLASAVLD